MVDLMKEWACFPQVILEIKRNWNEKKQVHPEKADCQTPITVEGLG